MKIHIEYFFAFLLVALWLLGIFTGYTMGGFIHILPVVAGTALLIKFLEGRRI